MIRVEIVRLIKAFGYSRDGLLACFRDDAPFRLEVYASIVIVPLGFWLGHSGLERGALVGAWLLVLIVELLNCGLESLTDYATSFERHELAKKTKDVGSAAVLVALATWMTVWVCILG